MSLVADALQPAMVRGLFALRGRASIAHLPDMITGSRSGFYLDFADPNDVRIDFGDPGFVADAIGGDSCRFAIAAFVSLHDLQEMTDAKSLAWAIIKLYYSAYYAGPCVLRLSGQSCSNLDRNHISKLQQIASATNPGQSFPLSRGLHHCVLQASQSAFSIRKAQISTDGNHGTFWKIFVSFLSSNDEKVLGGHLPPTDARVVFTKLTSLQNVLSGRGATAGNWLSQIRNSVQYRHEQSTWPPFSLRKADRDLLLRLAAQWKIDPMSIELDYPPGGDLGSFMSACSFLVALCRALFERVSKLSSEGHQSFAYRALQYT